MAASMHQQVEMEPYCLWCQEVMTGDLMPGQGDDFNQMKFCCQSCEDEYEAAVDG